MQKHTVCGCFTVYCSKTMHSKELSKTKQYQTNQTSFAFSTITVDNIQQQQQRSYSSYNAYIRAIIVQQTKTKQQQITTTKKRRS